MNDNDELIRKQCERYAARMEEVGREQVRQEEAWKREREHSCMKQKRKKTRKEVNRRKNKAARKARQR